MSSAPDPAIEQRLQNHELSVAVIAVTWNRKQDLLNAIASLKQQTYPVDQIIVADNGSSDGTVETLRETHPEVLVVELDENLGACRGRNAATRRATTDLVYYIDDDITLESDCVREMVRAFLEYPGVGAVLNTIVDPWDGPDKGGDAIPRYCPHPREGALGVRLKLLSPDPWPDHFNRQGEGPWIALHLYDKGYETVFWGAGRANHHCAPGGQRERVLFFFSRNSVLTYYQLFPLRWLPLMVPYKALRPLLNVRRPIDLMNWLRAMGSCLRLILSGKAPRRPLTSGAVRRYFRALKHRGEAVPTEAMGKGMWGA